MWAELCRQGGPRGVAPSLLRDLGIYGGMQGVWVDKARTHTLTSDGHGVTVGLLHTGSAYPDDLSDEGVLYHYPATGRRGKDDAEVAATRSAGRLGLPVFVITYPTPHSSRRDVTLAWVEGWDDAARHFLITFGDRQPPLVLSDEEPEEPFQLFREAARTLATVAVRRGQQRFKYQVLKRYGPRCAVCGLAVPELLDAAHIGPKNVNGSDDPRNGLVLCATHHRAFDGGLFAVHPGTLAVRYRSTGPTAADLRITVESLAALTRTPHRDALEWRWRRWAGGTATMSGEQPVSS
jgi:hypothetical protein